MNCVNFAATFLASERAIAFAVSFARSGPDELRSDCRGSP
jgi:hypothetical protein